MTIQEQRRKAFEEYCIRGSYPIAWTEVLGRFMDQEVQDMWKGWNAALDSVGVELPPNVDAEDVAEHFEIDDDGLDMAEDIASMVNGSIAACGAFIRAAGLRVKG